MPRCLFINTFYDGFLRQEYSRHPELSTAPYDTQLKHLNDQLFGDSDFYSSGLIDAGFEARDIVVNCTELQGQYAKEQRIADPNLFRIIEHQIEAFDPDVLYIQDLNLFQQATSRTAQNARPTSEGGRADCIAYSRECALAAL